MTPNSRQHEIVDLAPTQACPVVAPRRGSASGEPDDDAPDRHRGPDANPHSSARNECRLRRSVCDEPHDELVRLASKGRQDAWDELVHRFGGLIHRVAKRNGLTDRDAADVAQITWLRLMGNFDRLRDPCRIAGWLATTARRESVRVAIRAARGVLSADPVAYYKSDTDTAPAADPLRLEFDDPAIERALVCLPSQYQRLLRLLISDADLSYAQVANTLGISIGSVGPMRQRALQLLRRDLTRTNR